MITLIEAGCAECHDGGDEPLIERREFAGVEEAKAWALKQRWVTGYLGVVNWQQHPQGGEHVVVGQGSLWILPEKVQQ